jgi:hypothetical protein
LLFIREENIQSRNEQTYLWIDCHNIFETTKVSSAEKEAAPWAGKTHKMSKLFQNDKLASARRTFTSEINSNMRPDTQPYRMQRVKNKSKRQPWFGVASVP